MRGWVIPAVAFAAGLALGYFVWKEGGAGGRATRVVHQTAAEPDKRASRTETPAPDAPPEGALRVPVAVEVDGGPAAERARILVVRPRGKSAQNWSSDSPWIELPAGTWELRAELDEPARSRSPVRTVVIDESATPLRFVVRRRPALAVDVRPASSFVDATLVCWIRRMSGAAEPSAAFVAGGRHAFRRDGTRFLWRDLEPGRYAVGAGYAEIVPDVPQAVGAVEVSRGVAEFAIDLADPPADDALRVRLLDPAGGPVTRVLWDVFSGGSGSTGVASVVRSDGVHFLPPLGKAPGTKFEIKARSADWGVASRRCTWDPARVVEIRYDAVARVTATVAGCAGSGYEGRIRFRWENPESDEQPMIDDFGPAGTVASDGAIAAHAQQAGEWRLAIYVTRQQFGMATVRRVATKLVALRPGSRHVTIELPRLYELKVRWAGEEERPDSVSIRPEGAKDEYENMLFAEFDDDGIARFDTLVAGRYLVLSPTLAADGKPPVVEVPAQAEFDIR